MEIKQMFTSVDTNTEGGPTRIVTSGVFRLKGASVSEKRDYFRVGYDSLRDGLLNHPRGYPGMFGAILMEPSHPDADVGVFFMTNTGYLNMCVHSAMGVAAACIETGIIPPCEGGIDVTLDTPAGLIKLKAEYTDGQLGNIAVEPGPAFVHTSLIDVVLEDGLVVKASLIFSVVLFIMIDVAPLGMRVDKDHESRLKSLAVKAIETVNRDMANDVAGQKAPSAVDLAFLYEDTGDSSCKSAVYSKTGVLDQSPCGAGTAAKMTMMYHGRKLELNMEYTNENMFNTKFKGQLVQCLKEGQYEKVRSVISGTANVTGFHRFVFGPSDLLCIEP